MITNKCLPIPICRTVKAAADRIVGGCAILCRDYSVVMRCAKSMIPCRNMSNGVNVFSSGSPSRMRRVRRISLGMTIRPRSSTRRTIPVAVPDIFVGFQKPSSSVDRGHSLRSLLPPLAALPSLPFDSLRSLRMTETLGNCQLSIINYQLSTSMIALSVTLIA